ncbi:MAG: CPBP family intramembrane metalloprotease [Planctomycetes bacterium]|nr:CPBP family intramembrane metalloprotease [Planctomycetota bacterium]
MKVNRFSRINTIWRKELLDLLRDRRTLIAMILVPMVLYPVLMLGSLQAVEARSVRAVTDVYDIAVQSEEVNRWLRRAIDTHPARGANARVRPAEDLIERERAEPTRPEDEPPSAGPIEEETFDDNGAAGPMPDFKIFVEPDPAEAVKSGKRHVGIVIEGGLPSHAGSASAKLTLVMDETDYWSNWAARELRKVLARKNNALLEQRLERIERGLEFVRPIELNILSVATPEKRGGSVLGLIVPLILIVMTITGAIYPAIDLTAGERERGTLETLMVAPIPTIDLITGKFIVVTLIGLLSGVLNLLSIGGTIYFGGLGNILTGSGDIEFPLWAMPWILVLLVPLAVMFSATLLAVCSFARSFKEAQNYVMPVMVMALIPAVVGALPGTRLEGPLLIMPVANIVALTRELFMGTVNFESIAWVTLSTCLYAAAAVAVAAKLFGQEAVLFADSGSLKTVFQRKFFKPALVPTIAQALLLLAIIYPENFFLQQAIADLSGDIGFLAALALIFIVLFVLLPMIAAMYMRVAIPSTFSLARPPSRAIVAALCFGAATWILALAWQPALPEEIRQALEQQLGWMDKMSVPTLIFFLAFVPAVCEELFFRGYVLSGLRGALGRMGALGVSAVAFGIYHGSVYRLPTTIVLGVLFGLLVYQFRSIWPAMIAHCMHNTISILAASSEGGGIQGWLREVGFADGADGMLEPPLLWICGAVGLVAIGILLCLTQSGQSVRHHSEAIAVESEPTRSANVV